MNKETKIVTVDFKTKTILKIAYVNNETEEQIEYVMFEKQEVVNE